jgi:hypothetical protein
MRATVCCSLVAATVVSGCYLAHERPDQPIDATVAPDVASADAGMDAPPPADAPALDAGPNDAFRCAPLGTGRAWPGPCSPEIQSECVREAEAAALGRSVHTSCLTIGDGVHMAFQSYCVPGDICTPGVECLCTPTRACANRVELCVSDAPDGARYCARACPR